MSKFIELTVVLPDGKKTKRCFNSRYIFSIHEAKDGTTRVTFCDIEWELGELIVEESYSEVVDFLK